jgi:WS/DGAT/MGAT family acyltransferase
MSTTVWGAAWRMSDLEAVFWRAEVDPHLRSGGVVLDLLESAPEWERLVAAHRWAVAQVPRLRERVVDDPSRLGPPRWVPADLDLGYHLTHVRLPGGSGQPELLDLVAALHMEPLDPSRPLWRAVLVEGLADGSAAYLLKVHHSMADGTAAIQLFDLLHGHEPTSRSTYPAVELDAAQVVGTADVVVASAKELASAVPAVMRRASRLFGAVVHDPVAQATRATSYAASVVRVSRGTGATASPLLAHRGLARRVRTLEVPLVDLKAAGHAGGGTLNDAFLAGLLGGLGRYHAWHEVEVGDLPIALPVSLRDAADPVGGNRFAAASLAGPAGEQDPVRRVALVHARVGAARREVALDLMGTLAPVASRLPAGLLAKAARRMSGSLDLQASSISGLTRDAYLAGARISRMFVFGPVPGSAVMATLVSHQGTCCIAITTDHDAVPDPDVVERGVPPCVYDVGDDGRGG